MDDASFEDGRHRRAATGVREAPDPPGSHPSGAHPSRSGAHPPGSGTPRPSDPDDDDDVAGPEVDEIRGFLFDAALRSLVRAGRALGASGSAVASMGLSEIVRARRTLDELRTRAQVQWLGGDAGDATAETLVSLYDFCSDRLAQAARTRDPQLIPAVVDVLTELRDAFAE